MRQRVAVIGGGIVGLCCARELAIANCEVELFERHWLGAGATGSSAGNVHAQLEHRMLAPGERWPDYALGARLESTRPAIDAWARLARDLTLELRPSQGGFVVAETAEQVRALEERVAIESGAGLPTVLLDGAEVRARVDGLSARVRAASFSPLEGFVDLPEVVRELARDCARRGVAITPGTTAILAEDSCALWLAGAEQSEPFDGIVAACGPFSAELDRSLSGEAVPVGLSLLRCPASDLAPGALIQHAGRRLSLKRLPGGDLVIGGGLPASLEVDGGRLTGSVEVDPEIARAGLEAAAAVLARPPAPDRVRVLGGVAALSVSRAPAVVRELAGRPGVFVALAEQGITHAPWVGARVAARIAGSTGSTGPAATSAVATVGGP